MPIISRISLQEPTSISVSPSVSFLSFPMRFYLREDRPGHTVKRRSSDNEDGLLEIFQQNLISDWTPALIPSHRRASESGFPNSDPKRFQRRFDDDDAAAAAASPSIENDGFSCTWDFQHGRQPVSKTNDLQVRGICRMIGYQLAIHN